MKYLRWAGTHRSDNGRKEFSNSLFSLMKSRYFVLDLQDLYSRCLSSEPAIEELGGSVEEMGRASMRAQVSLNLCTD